MTATDVGRSNRSTDRASDTCSRVGDALVELVRHVEVHDEVLDTLLPRPHRSEPGVDEDPLHPAILGECVGDELGQSFATGCAARCSRQQRADAGALPGVG